MLLLSIVFIGSLALTLPASAELHKKIVIHLPLEIHEKHHTHTVYKHVYHKQKEEQKHAETKHKHVETKHKHHGKGKDSYEFLGYSYGNPSSWKEEKEGSWKNEETKWPGTQWKESHKHETKSQWHGAKKNPHRISSYIPNYNHEKKRAEIFEHENEHHEHHKHTASHYGGHKYSGGSDEDFDSFKNFGRDLKGSGSYKHFDHHDEEGDYEDDKKKNIGLGITKVISHTVYHD